MIVVFEDKKKYYSGIINSKNQHKEGIKISELLNFSEIEKTL